MAVFILTNHTNVKAKRTTIRSLFPSFITLQVGEPYLACFVVEHRVERTKEGVSKQPLIRSLTWFDPKPTLHQPRTRFVGNPYDVRPPGNTQRVAIKGELQIGKVLHTIACRIYRAYCINQILRIWRGNKHEACPGVNDGSTAVGFGTEIFTSELNLSCIQRPLSACL
jgi:hypothetical protein